MVYQEILEKEGLLDHRVLKEMQDQKEILVKLVHAVLKEMQDQKEIKEIAEFKESQGLRDPLDLKGYKVFKVQLE
jgi:hypothetical protein